MNETMIEKGFTEPTDRVKRLKKMIVEARPMVETYRAGNTDVQGNGRHDGNHAPRKGG